MPADPTPADPTPATACDPRVERSRRVVLAAALEVLADTGYGGLTIEAVAARAGVGKATIYRHWPNKLALVEDAFETLKDDTMPPADGCVRDRVIAMLTVVAAKVARSTWSTCMPALIEAAERDPQLRAVHRRFSGERRAALVGLLRDGVAAGELPPAIDLDLLADALVGPIFVRRLMTDEPLDPADVPRLVDQVLPAIDPMVRPSRRRRPASATGTATATSTVTGRSARAART